MLLLKQIPNPSKGVTIVVTAGPLLLNALLRHMKEARDADDAGRDGHPVVVGAEAWAQIPWIPSPGSLAYGCCCVALLGLAAVLKVGPVSPHAIYSSNSRQASCMVSGMS